VEIPLFPLHSVLCPGVALPLHIFEPRYREMVTRCVDRDEPFGVVLIREGRDVGTPPSRLAEVGTTARIRQAGRYPDGRLDIVTIGERRFRIDGVHDGIAPYAVADVSLLDEPLGGRENDLLRAADRVGRRFLRYLDLLQPALAEGGGPEIEIEVEIEAPDDGGDDAVLDPDARVQVGDVAAIDETRSLDTSGLTEDQRRELLMSAARRLLVPGDPTALSYLLTGLIQVELPSRQRLLEAPDTLERLRALDALLAREIDLLSRALKPLTIQPGLGALRRN
jgi:Lon protease-like protein